ncbi:MAG: SAVED domain-containing protein [Caldilineaceae bacterium]|nr:SAVED domain-containing protein [Caldilineaceae bacterium]
MNLDSVQKIETSGGSAIGGAVTAGNNVIGRDNITIANHGLLILQQSVTEVKRQTGGVVDLGTQASTNVKLLQQGKQLHTYLFSHQSTDQDRSSQGRSTSKLVPDVAVLVDINRRILRDVARYLDEQQIQATLIIVTNDPTYSDQTPFLDVSNPSVWTALVQEFNAAITHINHYVGPANFHFFLSVPLPLAFGLGAVWGTVGEAVVYHYEKNTYHPVMKISRNLRNVP